MKKEGKFVVLEGIDGSGKTTLTHRLVKELDCLGIEHINLREPSDGAVGALIRKALRGEVEFTPQTMAQLFAADRLDNVHRNIEPALNEGKFVLCDRFVFSSLAYQSLDMSIIDIIGLNNHVINTIAPDLTVFIDVSPEVSFERMRKTRSNVELFEQIDILKAVRENYLLAFSALPQFPVTIVDGDKSADTVFNEVWKYISDEYPAKRQILKY
ncbi:MAG: dTMP kinase [Defluviitaleaceae bacterium]|nr:dTMP kinase [Defluviitaleaceae bacterium]